MLLVLDRPDLDTIISIDLVKQHLRVEHAAEDDLIKLYRDAAMEFLEEHTTLVGGPTLFEESFDAWNCFGDSSSLSRAPVREIVSVQYLDEDDALQAISDADWYFKRSVEGGKVYFIDDFDLPDLSTQKLPIRIQYQAGFDIGDESGTGDDPSLRRPRRFDQAVFLLCGHWYQNRETVNIGNIVNNLPLAFDSIAHQLRVFR